MNQRNMAASVRARLLNRAREIRQDFNLILTAMRLSACFIGSAFPLTPTSSC